MAELQSQQQDLFRRVFEYLAGKGKTVSFSHMSADRYKGEDDGEVFECDWIGFQARYANAITAINSKAQERALKLTGVEFEGVMCSATSVDMWGLNAVKTSLETGLLTSTRFDFENGNSLPIGTHNMEAFMAKWVPFRNGFYTT